MREQSDRKWESNQGYIFAQIDAFKQRCTELKEICDGMKQFMRREGEKYPIFGGTKGPEIQKNLLEIEKRFKQNLSFIEARKDEILDAKTTRWHDDYSTYKSAIKDLEVMFNNIMEVAFQNVSTVKSGIELVEKFHTLAKRTNIKSQVEGKMANNVLQMFNKEINEVVKKE